MRRSNVVAACLSSWLLLICLSPASAFPLTNCTMRLEAHDADGAMFDWVTGGLVDSEVDEPFEVEWGGSFLYEATTGPLTIRDYTAHLEVYGIPVLRRDHANDDGEQVSNGSLALAPDVPFRITGLYFISGAIRGNGGSCDGNGWLKIPGDPARTVPFWFALGATLLGLLLFVAAVRVRGGVGIAASLIGGFVVGVALTILCIIYSIVPFGNWTPEVIVMVGLVVGIAVRSRHGPDAFRVR